MTAPEGVEAFLEAEAEAWRLVDELRRLKGEVESYHTARSALGETGASMARLADELTNVAHRLGEVVQTLRTIGTPELLRAQAAAATEIRRSVDTSVIAQRAALTETTNELLGAQETATAEVAALRSEIEETRGSLERVSGELLRVQDSTAQQLRSLRSLLFVSVGTTLLGFFAVAILVLARV